MLDTHMLHTVMSAVSVCSSVTSVMFLHRHKHLQSEGCRWWNRLTGLMQRTGSVASWEAGELLSRALAPQWRTTSQADIILKSTLGSSLTGWWHGGEASQCRLWLWYLQPPDVCSALHTHLTDNCNLQRNDTKTSSACWQRTLLFTAWILHNRDVRKSKLQFSNFK